MALSEFLSPSFEVSLRRKMSLVALCASHVGDELRLEALLEMLKSWQKQTVRCVLHLNISFSASHLQRSFEERTYPNLVVHYGQERCQFLKYRELFATLRESTATWFIFTDDDDIWHEERVETYRRALPYANEKTSAINSLWYVETPGEDRLFRYEDVERALESGFASFREMPRFSGNYVTYAVPLLVLKEFFSKATELVLEQKFADVYFCRFVRTYRQQSQYTTLLLSRVPEAGWMYFYRRFGESTTKKLNIASLSKLQEVRALDRSLLLLLNNIELTLGYLKGDDLTNLRWEKELEVMCIKRGMPLLDIVEARKEYPQVREILASDYYRRLHQDLVKLFA